MRPKGVGAPCPDVFKEPTVTRLSWLLFDIKCYKRFQKTIMIIFLSNIFSVSFSCDRNCLFRSLADQLEGDHNRHAALRKSTIQFMRENSIDFEPFHDGETTFNEYCKAWILRMKK